MAQKVTPEQFNNILSNKSKSIKQNLPKAIKLCCEQVRSTILDDMAKTPRNMNVSYFTHNKTIAHHPSLPGNAPAPDSGNLRASIHYTVDGEGKETIGRVGTDVEYGKHLEFGTTKMAPRPWLKPAMDKNKTFIQKTIKEALND